MHNPFPIVTRLSGISDRLDHSLEGGNEVVPLAADQSGNQIFQLVQIYLQLISVQSHRTASGRRR